MTDESKPGPRPSGGGNVSVGGSNTGNIATSGATITNRGSFNRGDAGSAALTEIFNALLEKVAAAPPADQAITTPMVQQLQATAEKLQAGAGQPEDENFFEQRLKVLAAMAPDIGEVAIATLANPPAGIALVIKKIAEKVKAELKPAAGAAKAP
jgi:hypothetical protein